MKNAISSEYKMILENSVHFTNIWFVNPGNALLLRVKSDEAALKKIFEKRAEADVQSLLIFETEFMPADESVYIDNTGRRWVIPSASRGSNGR